MHIRLHIQNAQFLKATLQDTEILFGIVRGDSFRDVKIPLSPNPRSFTGKVNKNYTRMLHTIINEPHLFIHKNASGITVFVSDYELHEDGSVTLVVDGRKDGIANGGHTYEILRNFGTAKAHVKMQIVKGLSDEHLIDVVESLNLSKRIEQFSLENRRGRFDWHKEALGDLSEDVSYHEGDAGLTDVRESIGALHVFLFTREGEKRALSAYRGSVNVNHHALKKLDQEIYARQIAGIARDVHRLHRFIVSNPHYLAVSKMSHTRGWKRRLPNGEYGLIRSVANLVLLGVAIAGTQLGEGGEAQWRQGYSTHDLRCSFANQMFQKVFDVLVLEDDPLSHVCKRQDVIEKVARYAELMAGCHQDAMQMTLI